jgi:hypothetical protein
MIVRKDLTEAKNKCKIITHNLPISLEKTEFVTYSLPKCALYSNGRYLAAPIQGQSSILRVTGKKY